MEQDDNKKLGLIELCLGTDADGDEAFIYVHVRMDRYDAYKAISVSGEPFDPEDYGVVVAHGKGSPSAEIVADLRRKYPVWGGYQKSAGEPAEQEPKKQNRKY